MFPRRHDINVNIQMPTTNIDHVVEHRHDDEVVLMERSGEMDIREDEQGRKTGVETFACGTCGQQVTLLTSVRFGDDVGLDRRDSHRFRN